MLTARRFTIAALLVLLLAASGCSRPPEGGSPAGNQPQSGETEATLVPLVATPSGAFEQAKDDSPACTIEKDVDKLLRPALTATFGGAKLKSCGTCDTTPVTCQSYLVKRQIVETDGDLLYKALVTAGAKERSSPRVYRANGTVELSVTFSVDGKERSVTVVLDLSNQAVKIRVVG